MILLDTDVVIDIQRGHSPAIDWFSGLIELPSLTGFAVMELIQGTLNAVAVHKIETLVAPFPIIWPTRSDCEMALRTFRQNRLSHGMGLLDSMIAAIAVGQSADLCTLNVKHFRMVSQLRIIQPYAR